MPQATAGPVTTALSSGDGVGPLIQRDYWAELDGVSCPPEAICHRVRCRFEEFAPAETAVFRRDCAAGQPLEVGDELEIRIALKGKCRVRVIHTNDRSLTLQTLKGHPEAGRITFAADHDESGRPVFRIRSRTRANGWLNYLGYHVIGRQLQSRCWINFVGKVAESCGGNVRDYVHVRTTIVEEQPGESASDLPTIDGADLAPCSESR